MRRVTKRLSVLCGIGLALACASASAQSSPTAWELSPYRIKLIVAVEPGGEISSGFEQDLAADLVARVAAAVGGSWRVEVLPPPAELRQKLTTSLGTITAEALPAAALDSDKVLLVSVRADGGAYRIGARELDTVTRLWNSTIVAEVTQQQVIGPQAFQAMLRAFAPLARIESTEGKTATLRLRAGALARRDRILPTVLPGAAFRPVLVKSDTRGALTAGSGEAVAGVYLSPTSTSGSTITCRIDAGIGSAVLPAYHPHRQRLALGVSPAAGSTKLTLVSRGEPSAPLEGYDVLDGQDLLGRTDRRGLVSVSSGKEAVRMLTIRRGGSTLAQLPIVPGLAPEITLPLAAGDDGSLVLEAQVAALEDALIDLVARRQVLAARIRAAAKNRDMAGGQALLAQLRNITPADALATQLGQAEQSLASAGAEAKERLRAKLDAVKQALEKFRAESPADQLETELKNAAASP